MSDEWVLVPLDFVCDCLANGFGDFQKRPPIPRAVWDAMVERAHVALWTAGKYNGVDTALRAALGNPTIEETYEDWSARITGVQP